MNRIMKNITFFCLLMFLVLPFTASAQSGCVAMGANASALPRCVNQIYTWSLGIAALLAVLVIIAGGYLITTASGSGEQTAKGKEMIVGAITGLVLLIGAYLILKTINPDLVNFNLDSINSL